MKDFLPVRNAPGNGSSILLVVVRAWLLSRAFFFAFFLGKLAENVQGEIVEFLPIHWSFSVSNK